MKYILLFILVSGCTPISPNASGALTNPLGKELTPEQLQEYSGLEARLATESAWDDVYGVEVTPSCDTGLKNIPIISVSKEDIESAHGPRMLAWVTDKIEIVSTVSNEKRKSILVHEFIHTLGRCMIGDPSNNHSNPLMFTCVGSVEHLGMAYIGTYVQSEYVCAKDKETT